LADYAAIAQLLYRYCAAHDSRDLEKLGECFASDVELLGARGRQAVVDRYASGYQHLTKQRRHILTNVFIVEDGEEEALVQSYITLYLIHEGQLQLHLTGVYRDRVVIEDGQWRIRSRQATMDVEYNPGDTAPAKAATYESSAAR
jgi:3-phenylpropionate/cinnamic acid dioxygenase small subunit